MLFAKALDFGIKYSVETENIKAIIKTNTAPFQVLRPLSKPHSPEAWVVLFFTGFPHG